MCDLVLAELLLLSTAHWNPLNPEFLDGIFFAEINSQNIL
jgi:hypothetical protein